MFCGLAGTTSRFLTGLLALIQDDIIINGEGKILERPIGDLVDACGIYFENGTRLVKNVRTPIARGTVLKLADDNCKVLFM